MEIFWGVIGIRDRGLEVGSAGCRVYAGLVSEENGRCHTTAVKKKGTVWQHRCRVDEAGLTQIGLALSTMGICSYVASFA